MVAWDEIFSCGHFCFTSGVVTADFSGDGQQSVAHSLCPGSEQFDFAGGSLPAFNFYGIIAAVYQIGGNQHLA